MWKSKFVIDCTKMLNTFTVNQSSKVRIMCNVMYIFETNENFGRTVMYNEFNKYHIIHINLKMSV